MLHKLESFLLTRRGLIFHKLLEYEKVLALPPFVLDLSCVRPKYDIISRKSVLHLRHVAHAIATSHSDDMILLKVTASVIALSQ